MNDILVSVIIPVYNAEKYLEECLESLINQTLDKCEFIFVNDGSKDSSITIIEKYKKFDNRISLLNQKNKGVSSARNRGISLAKGKYISFVDADDSLESEMLKKLYEAIENNGCDLAMCNYKTKLDGYNQQSFYDIPINEKLNREYILNNMLHTFYEGGMFNALWNKLYRKEIIDKNQIKFPKDISLGEDGIFNFKYLQLAQSFIYIPYIGYNYREVEGSATRNIINKDYFKQDLFIYNYKLPLTGGINLNEDDIEKLKIKKFINSIISNIYIYLRPDNNLHFKKKIRYVKNMINNDEVVHALPIYIDNYYDEKSRYEKIIIQMIKNKLTIELYIVTLYSWFKNR